MLTSYGVYIHTVTTCTQLHVQGIIEWWTNTQGSPGRSITAGQYDNNGILRTSG